MSADEATRTFFVIQGFSREFDRVRMDEPITARTRTAALRIAERLAARRVSVMVLARTGNLETGEFDEPVLLKSFGEPAGVDDLPF